MHRRKGWGLRCIAGGDTKKGLCTATGGPILGPNLEREDAPEKGAILRPESHSKVRPRLNLRLGGVLSSRALDVAFSAIGLSAVSPHTANHHHARIYGNLGRRSATRG